MQSLPTAGRVYTVTLLTEALKRCLEEHFQSFWVEGEISNFRVPSSGHFYFTLRDQESQVRAIMFRSRNALLRFIPEDGMQVICRGSLSVYPPRGEYQVVVDLMEPKGVGALQIAFEALKRKLASEGLFDPERKRPIPLLPRTIGVVTSPSGAALRDIAKIVWSRFPTVEIRLRPVRVQGEGAAEEIAQAIEDLNQDGRADVIIVGRGGGSLEDLWAFNEEAVARAIHASRIPVISAVGHEVDFTIADFVADVRASTPSAAAEMVVPHKERVQAAIEEFVSRLLRNCRARLERSRREVALLSARLASPGRRIQEYRVRIDDLLEELSRHMGRTIETLRRRVAGSRERIFWYGPSSMVKVLAVRVGGLRRELSRAAWALVETKRERCRSLIKCLESLSPLGVLARGYSIARLLPQRSVVRSVRHVSLGDRLELILSQGTLECCIESVKE